MLACLAPEQALARDPENLHHSSQRVIICKGVRAEFVEPQIGEQFIDYHPQGWYYGFSSPELSAENAMEVTDPLHGPLRGDDATEDTVSLDGPCFTPFVVEVEPVVYEILWRRWKVVIRDAVAKRLDPPPHVE